MAAEASGAQESVKTLNGRRYVVPACPKAGLVRIHGREYVFEVSVLYKGGDILKIQRGKVFYAIHKGEGEEIITSDYFQSSLHPTEGGGQPIINPLP